MEKTTGKYDLQTGKIFNTMGNMRRGDILDAYGTFIHETQHVHFNCLTLAGGIMELLRIELNMTPKTDRQHYNKTKALMDILGEEYEELQEIYANSMELLWIEEYQGVEQAEIVYERKDELYKKYSRRFQGITKNCKTIEEKRNIIQSICIKAARPDADLSGIAELLTDADVLQEYFDHKGSVEERLELLIEEYDSPAIPYDQGYEDEARITIVELSPMLIRNGTIVYAAEIVAFGVNMVETMSETDFAGMLTDNYQDTIVKRTSVFDFIQAAESMKVIHTKWDKEYLCVIWNYSELLYPQDDFLLLSYSPDDHNYIGQEAAREELAEALAVSKAVIVDFKEFDVRKNRPKYFCMPNIPLFVVLTEYHQCESWIEDILEEDLYIVDLYPEDIQNFFTILFFRRRKEPDIIFVFPTLKYLAELLIRKFNLKEKVMLSQEQRSLKLFAGFKGEVQMLYVITWVFAFLSGTQWDGCNMQKASSILSRDFVHTLLDSVLQIRDKDYWFHQAALPTLKTESDGLYAVMRFEDSQNTGILCSQQVNNVDYPIFFKDKAAADRYRGLLSDCLEFRVVAVDDFYWNVLSEYLRRGHGKWCLYIHEDQGILLDIEKYNEVIRN